MGLHRTTQPNVNKCGQGRGWGGAVVAGPAEPWEPHILKSNGKGMGVFSTTHPDKTFLNQEMGA